MSRGVIKQIIGPVVGMLAFAPLEMLAHHFHFINVPTADPMHFSGRSVR